MEEGLTLILNNGEEVTGAFRYWLLLNSLIEGGGGSWVCWDCWGLFSCSFSFGVIGWELANSAINLWYRCWLFVTNKDLEKDTKTREHIAHQSMHLLWLSPGLELWWNRCTAHNIHQIHTICITTKYHARMCGSCVIKLLVTFAVSWSKWNIH